MQTTWASAESELWTKNLCGRRQWQTGAIARPCGERSGAGVVACPPLKALQNTLLPPSQASFKLQSTAGAARLTNCNPAGYSLLL